MMKHMVWGVALLASVALMGCTEPGDMNRGATRDQLPGATAYVGVEQLAQELSMTLISTSRCHATLRGPSNFVVIYVDPNGQVFVNGQAVCPSGAFNRDGEMLVLAGVRDEIRKHLVPDRVAAPPVAVVIPPRQPQPAVVADPPRPLRGCVVMIDPGHGGKDPGARSVLGYWEAPVALAVGRQVKAMLQESGVTVEMTRDGAKTELDKHGRAALSSKRKPDVFVSIHADAADRVSANGYTIYIARRADARSRAAAEAVERSMRRAGFARHSAAPVAHADFVVLKDNTQPAVLVELGFLTNQADATRLRNADYQAKYAAAICEGILDYLRRANGGE